MQDLLGGDFCTGLREKRCLQPSPARVCCVLSFANQVLILSVSFCTVWELTAISLCILSHLSESAGFTHAPLSFVSQCECPEELHIDAFIRSLIKFQFVEKKKISVVSVEKYFTRPESGSTTMH